MGINNARFDLAYVFGGNQFHNGSLGLNSSTNARKCRLPRPFFHAENCLSISPKLARTNVDINRSSLYGKVRYPRRGLDVRILINR